MMTEGSDRKPLPAHKSKLGLSKLIVQALALLVAAGNYWYGLDFEFTETHAAVVVTVLESLWQGKQARERAKIRKETP
jgi:hypothetical protein